MARNNRTADASALVPSQDAPVQNASGTDLAPITTDAPMTPAVQDAATPETDAVSRIRALTNASLTGNGVFNADGVPHRGKSGIYKSDGTRMGRLCAYIVQSPTLHAYVLSTAASVEKIDAANTVVAVDLAGDAGAVVERFRRVYQAISGAWYSDTPGWTTGEMIASQFTPAAILPLVNASARQYRTGWYSQRGNRAFAGTRVRRVKAADAPVLTDGTALNV